MKTIGIIQARIGSKRLPNKMLLSLHGKPIIEWVVHRVKKSKLLDEIIVAIPNTAENDILEKYCTSYGVKVYRGSENDVLDRFYKTAKLYNADKIVRICADNPLIDPVEVDNLVRYYDNNECDYAYNHIPKNNKYPDGLGAEIISMELLNQLKVKVKLKEHREHCFSYITDNKSNYTIKTFDPSNQEMCFPELRFDIDTFEDYINMHNVSYYIDIKSIDAIILLKEYSNY